MDDIFDGLVGCMFAGVYVSKGDEWADKEPEGSVMITGWPKGDHRECVPIALITTDAECCSETWFADICGAVAAYSGIITAARWLDLPDVNDDRSRQEFDQVYGFEIVTTNGPVTFAFRNSSNGYYGGDALRLPLDEVANFAWRLITTNDWQA